MSEIARPKLPWRWRRVVPVNSGHPWRMVADDPGSMREFWRSANGDMWCLDWATPDGLTRWGTRDEFVARITDDMEFTPYGTELFKDFI